MQSGASTATSRRYFFQSPQYGCVAPLVPKRKSTPKQILGGGGYLLSYTAEKEAGAPYQRPARTIRIIRHTTPHPTTPSLSSIAARCAMPHPHYQQHNTAVAAHYVPTRWPLSSSILATRGAVPHTTNSSTKQQYPRATHPSPNQTRPTHSPR